ncbi:PREDICTED: centrosome-associated protein CEP250-like isoform X1 [Acropora digitifera]|uniref:centrosome-associated protein CEP250-like isoform X1 n=1 Tax=Acropora digitifera TaxID=70779 RepID=UPI00077AF375|nr:PREDICTED: centrosome-associated protein CEP250-like isoform X1 [Acropora digitifera]
MRITNVARLNVEVDYKVLAERLAKKLEDHDIKYKFEKLEYLREIQRLKSAITCYQESENFAGKDHEKLVSVIANLSKSVQREKEEKNTLQTELVCLKRQVSQPTGNNTPDVEAILLAELMSMELLANLQTPDVTKSILSDSTLSTKVKSHLALVDTQEALLNNAGCFLQLLDLHLNSEQSSEKREVASDESDCVQFNFSRAGSVELFSRDCSIKISPRGAPPEPCLSLPMYNTSCDESAGLAGGVRRMLGRLIGRDTKDRTQGSPDTHPSIRASLQGSTQGREEKSHDQEEAMRKTKALLKQLSNSREKVEQQVLSLMSSLFEEQIDKKEGQSPQWNELGKKLTRLIMFRRNNMPGLSDADVWANSEDLNSILENCLRFVIIDKALLACLLVIELLDLRKACAKLEDMKPLVNDIAQDNVTSTGKTQDESLGVKGNITATQDNKTKVRETEMISPRGSVSPRREKLSSLKHTRTELEMEITEMHEDTTKLETELFSTMEEKTKVEEELFGVKHYVTKLRSELFHLKLEKSNLEKDVKSSKSQENIQQSTDSDDAKPHVDSPKDGLRGYPELSDVMEASHESNDSENSSQMSDGNESREAFLKTCMESISKIYTFMPNAEEIVRSEDELSDDQEPTLSDANIDDSDEEIIITKLARSLRSPSKEKSFVAPSPNKSGKTEVLSSSKSLLRADDSDELSSKSKESLIKQIQQLKRKLHKVEEELVHTQETSEELEEELDHKKGQLAEAQQTITSLENQIVEEKETCEQIRQQYFNVKNQNDVLEEKIKALRSEFERVLMRENNSVTGALQSTEGVRGDNPPPSPRKSSKSFIKAPGKTKASKIDLRNPPSKQLTSSEMEVVGLIEENAELKVKLEKETQEKTRLERSQKFVEDKSNKTKASLQLSEDACNRLKSELSILAKEKAKLSGEVTDLRYNNSDITEELQRQRERSRRLEKDLEAIAYMSTRLEKDNKTLQDEISKMELELTSWKSKHQESSTESESARKERDHIEKECEKVHHELESLRKERKELLDQRISNEKESKRRDDEMKSKKERFYELESELSEQKRLNSNLQKELAGMSEYQEALEKEYSKAKTEEERLQQELIKLRPRSADSKPEFSLFTQSADDEDTSSGRNLLKPDLNRHEKTLKVKPSKKFYTITHTSEDEIGDTSSSIAESPADESKHLEHENQLLKLENGYLHQQLAESEQVLTMYRHDLESAHDLIDKLQANVKVEEDDNKTMVVEEDCKTPSDKDDTIKEMEDCSENSADEYRVLEEKHAELTREYEILRMHYQNVLTDKNKDTTEYSKEETNLNQVLFDENRAKELSNFRKEVARLQERIEHLEVENYQLKISGQEDSENENSRRNLLKKLEDEKRVKLTLQEKINAMESDNEAIRMKLEVLTMQKGRKPRRLSLDDQLACLMGEKEAAQAYTSQSLNCASSQSSPKASNQHELKKLDAGDEGKTRKLEEDLLKVSSEKLKLEFQLRSSQTDCERLRNDLDQSESERDLLNTQLDENIEKAANLEIRLMEMRCSCETIKNEINTLKNEKRQESFHLHEASVCKEILEKRLENALRENHLLHHELDILREEQKDSQNRSAKLEKDKDQLTEEIEGFKAQILRLEEDFEGDKARLAESTKAGNEPERKESVPLQKLLENKENGDKGQELLILREEIGKVTADYNRAKSELEEVRSAKKSLEKHIENMKETQFATSENIEPRLEAPNSCANENTLDSRRTTFDPIEIEKHTRILEKEKALLEKELTRVQEECNSLKEKLEIIKLSTENAQTQEERRIDLEQKQEQLEKELQELRELNQKLENESDDSHKLIHQLEVKTKALESLQKELRCFHEENDRLTHEVDIIHHTSKVMTDHQNCKDSLEKENSSLKQELEFLKHSNRKLQLQAEDLSKEIETLQQKSRDASSSVKVNASFQSELEKFQKMQQHLEGELSSCREKAKELENTNDSLKKENRAVKERIKSLEQRNEEMKRKEEKKKESNTESRSKAKAKAGQGMTRESKEVQTETNRIFEEADDSLQEKIKQLETEKFQLEKQLKISTKKAESECSSYLQEALEMNMSSQFSPEEETLIKMGKKSSTTLLGNKDEEEGREQQCKGEIAALTGNVRAGFTKMAKENLLLEKRASCFARSQMQLEQSFAKAMRENLFLSSKLVEADNIIAVLREKEQELENKKSTFLPMATTLKEILVTSQNTCGSEQDISSIEETKENQSDYVKGSLTKDAQEMKVLNSDGNGGQQSKSRRIAANDETEKEPKLDDAIVIHKEDSALSNANIPRKEESCLLNHTPELTEVQGPKSHVVILESESVPRRETMENETDVETVKADHQLTKSKQDKRVEKEQLHEQLEGLKSDKNEMERENPQHKNATNNPEYSTQSEVNHIQIKTCSSVHDESEKDYPESGLNGTKEDVEVEKETERRRCEEENALLKEERKALLDELEASKNERDVIGSELRYSKESCLKQKQEIKLLLSSYTQERESLLKELEDTKSDYRKAKDKIRELQQVEIDFDNIEKKTKEAEKIITELEKDLLSQTEMKNGLERELQTSRNRLEENELLETQLRASRAENEDLINTNIQLAQEVKKWKDEIEIKTEKIKWPKMEKKKSGNLNAYNPSLRDQSVQTESGPRGNVERPKDPIGADLPVQDTCNDAVHRLIHSNKPSKTNKHQEEDPSGQETAQTGELTANTSIMKSRTVHRVPIPVITVSCADEIEKMIRRDRTATLRLSDLEDFENESPNDQSTPDEEMKTIKPEKDVTNMKGRTKDTWCSVKSSEGRGKMLECIDQRKAGENSEGEPQACQTGSTIQNSKELRDVNSVLQNKKDTSAAGQERHNNEALEDQVMEMNLNQQRDMKIIFGHSKADASNCEMEWTISRLRSELQQRSEDIERSQHEISVLEEQQVSMKREISSLLNECESLKAKTAVLQKQNEAILKEQILNDDENEELQQNLQELTQEKNSIEETRRNLESQKARLEIELSDAIEARDAIEKELLRIRSEDNDLSRQRLQEQLHNISERYAKLETVLSCVLDENSKMSAEVSALQAENGMLKSFKIMEITDSYTQISPNHSEDESDTKLTTSPRRRQEIGDSKSAVISKSPSKQLTHWHSGQCDNFDSTAGCTQTSADLVISNTNSTASVDKGLGERKKEKPDRALITELWSSKLSHTTEKGEPPSVAKKEQRKQQRHIRKETSSYAQYNTLGDNMQMNLDDIDSSMEAHTDSSLVSTTDLDISISSQISSEDSSVVGSEIRVLQRMQKELAETKCTNVLITNELSIIRKHNSDLQNQVQKLLSRNNHLKSKMCDRTLSVKRMEKEMSSIKEENNRLQQQALILQEEMARVEKEKAKFERNMSSTKSENKRLKSDLSNAKAENYRTMKELVNLQGENRRLQLEIEKLRAEARSFKSGLSDESTSNELSTWETMSQRDFRSVSHRSLQERPATPDPAYLRQRAASDLNFSQYPGLENTPETPELSPLNLSKELHDQSTDGGNYRKTIISDVISSNSASGSRSSDPLSRRSSPISSASDSSLPSENDENAHKCEKDDGKEQAHGEEERGKNKTKIKAILRKLQHSKKNRTSK